MVVEGFMLSISTDDVVVSAGRLGDLAVDTATIDVSAEALGDGTHNVVVEDDGTIVAQLATAALTDGEFVVGQFTEDTAAATAINAAITEPARYL